MQQAGNPKVVQSSKELFAVTEKSFAQLEKTKASIEAYKAMDSKYKEEDNAILIKQEESIQQLLLVIKEFHLTVQQTTESDITIPASVDDTLLKLKAIQEVKESSAALSTKKSTVQKRAERNSE